MATRKDRRRQHGAENGHATPEADQAQADAYRRGQAKAWPNKPAFREFKDGRFRVDYGWLCARLGEMAKELGVPRAAHALAPSLAAVRLDRARTAREAAIAEGHEPPDDPDSPLVKEPDKLESSSAALINDIAQRRARPSDTTISELAELAARLKLVHSDRFEWSRRGGILPWDTPPAAVQVDEKHAYMMGALGEMLRRGGPSDEQFARLLKMADLLLGEDAASDAAREGRIQRPAVNGDVPAPD